MRFDIVPENNSYSGIDRSLMPDNFLTPETKQHYDTLLAIYFSYLDLMCNPNEPVCYDEKLFHLVRNFFRKFCDYNVSCEFIVFDTTPMGSVFGVSTELLGIDVVHDMAETLIDHNQLTSNTIWEKLNEKGLFRNLIDAKMAIDLFGVDGSSWTPCWVYKVLI